MLMCEALSSLRRPVFFEVMICRLTMWTAWALIAAAAVLGCAIEQCQADERGDRAKAKTVTPRSSQPKTEEILVMEREILRYTNEARKAKGLPLLQSSPALHYLARRQSENMCESQDFSHESGAFPEGWRKFDQRLRMVRVKAGAENIAYRTASKDSRKWAGAIVEGWLKSAEHRKNMLNRAYRYVGIGVRSCKHSICYATQVFSPETGRRPDHAHKSASLALP